MKATMKWLLLFMFIIFISACSKSGIKGNGNISSEPRALTPFTKIDVKGKFNVMLTGGSPEYVTVTTDSNLQTYVSTKVEGDELVISIKDNKNLISENPPVVTIRNPKIAAISVSGNNRIKGTELIQDALSLRALGASEIELEGKIANLNIETHGSANVNTVGLRADVVNINVSGSSKVSVDANKNLNVNISGDADVHYSGSPVIQQKISGSGRINALENK